MPVMLKTPIYFEFKDKHSFAQALDTLKELEYQVQPLLQIIPEQDDLTSALEIVQAHGGSLVERLDAVPVSEATAYSDAYGLEGIPIPAHLVAEDLSEDYMQRDDRVVRGSAADENEAHLDPTADDFAGFRAGIRL
jgi:hypothetical protein